MQYCQANSARVHLDLAWGTRYTLGKALMNKEYTFKSSTLFAQAYGGDPYGSEVYSNCQQTADGCIPTTSTENPPNTGFLGLSPDAAVASASGALLVTLAIVGTVYVLVSRARSRKKKTQE